MLSNRNKKKKKEVGEDQKCWGLWREYYINFDKIQPTKQMTFD